MPNWLTSFAPDATPFHLGLGAALVVFAITFALWLRAQLHRRVAEAQATSDNDAPVAWSLRQMARWLPLGVIAVGVLAAADLAELAPVREALAWFQSGLNHEITTIAGHPLTPMTGVTLAVTLAVGLQISRWVQAGVARAVRAGNNADEGVVASLQRLSHYAIVSLTLAFALQAAGFDLTALMAASTIFAVGLGFGLQNVVTNFVSGILLLMERSIKPGDILTVDGTLVRITEMGIRATIAVTQDDDEIIIPNSLLIENSVINHSFRSDVVRARALVGVSYDSDLDLVQRTLERVARAYEGRIAERDVVVQLTDFGASSVDFDVSIWVADAFVRPRQLSHLRHAIWKALHEEDIVIAYPQLDVHFDVPVTEAVTQVARRRSPPDPNADASS